VLGSFNSNRLPASSSALVPGRGHLEEMAMTCDEFKAEIRAAGYAPRRANGGYLLHAVKGNTSLCGHTPRDTRRMMRACWLPFGWAMPCAKCKKKVLEGSSP